MRIGILSRHAVANYGSLFQAYALQKTVEQLGHDAITINYIPQEEVGGNLANTLVNNTRWDKTLLIRMFYWVYQYLSCQYSYEQFKAFRKQFLRETREYHTIEALESNLPKVDIFCTGSDQVWNGLYSGELDPAYFLKFVPDEYKRISYGASFGADSFSSGNVKYHDLLKRYSYITVREDSGVKILNDMGLSGEQVLDPTLLLSESDWNAILPNKPRKEPYFLIYQLRPNKEFDQYAKKASRMYKKKLIRISTMFFQICKNGHFIYMPNPTEFLWLIKNADCLLTDSFHGSCFAINLNTPFVEILPGLNNARNESLLRLFNLNDRILCDYNDYSLIEKPIDYAIVRGLKSQYRRSSLDILNRIISQ